MVMACKVAPSAEPSGSGGCVIPKVPLLHTRGCCCQGQRCFTGAARCSVEKCSGTSIHTTNKSQVTAAPFSCSFFDVQHKMRVCSPSDCSASSHRPAPGPPPSSDKQQQQPRAQHWQSCPARMLPALGSLLSPGLPLASLGMETYRQSLYKPSKQQQKHRGNPIAFWRPKSQWVTYWLICLH